MGKVDVGGGKPLGPPLKVPVAAPPPKRIAPPPPKVPTPGPAPKHVAPTGYSRTRPSPKTPDRGSRPKAPGPRPLRSPGGDVQSGGYNFQAANRFKQTPAYRNAILSVFAHQPVQQKLAIVQGLTRNSTWNTPEGHAIKDYSISHLSQSEMRILEPHIPTGAGEPSLFSELGHTLGKIIAPGTGNYGGKNTTPGLPGGTIGNQYEMFGGPKGQLNLLKAGGQDLINLPAQTISTIGTIGGDVIGGHVGKAANDVIQPFVQAIKNPGAAIYGHPLDTYLMFGGGLHGASRVAAAPVRALARSDSLVGRAVSTAREAVALTGKLTHERPPFSRSPTVKAQQATVDKALYTRAPDGRLIPRSEQLRKHQMNQEIGSLVGVRERIRTVNREIAHTARAKAITPSKVRQVAHAAKTTLAYGPGRAAIPGASVLARIADTTIRRPDTLAKDLQTHLDQVAANRPNLTTAHDLRAHDEYVKTLQEALQNKALLKNPLPAFKAAEAYGKDYRPVEAALAKLGHYRDMTSKQLQRSTLLHYAVTHMGAKYDPEWGLVDAQGHLLPTRAILDHLRGPEGTGGRLPTFVSDRVRYDPEKQARGANYVSSERRPLPIPNQRNTLYAYTHGLTHPGHEALTEQHVLAQGILDSHRAMNHYVETLHTQLPGGGYARTHAQAEQAMRRAGITGYSPINTAEVFHPQESLNKAMENVSPAHIEEEAVLRSLNLEPLTQPGAEGRWGLIDNHAKKVLMEHQRQISPNTLLRTIRGLNNQFRTVALATSAKHIPGVVQENLIRDIAQGVGFRSWVTGRRVLQEAAKVDPARAREVRTRLTGGQVAGMTEAGKPYHVSDHWAGTSVHPFLKALEISSKTPGTRQLRTVWRQWTKLVIRGTKRALEEQHQVAGLGKYMLREHGYAEAAKAHGMLGLVQRAMTLHGKLLDDAAKGLFNESTAGQARAVIQQIYGKWTDLSPSAQTALMFSPFGLWWANSARFLARMPIDQPVKTGVLASATVGTQQERQAKGQDLFSPGALPLYEQGGIAIGNKMLAQNYYSPFGVANDPVATAGSLIQPWLAPIAGAAFPSAVNWLGHPLSSPQDPHGRKDANMAARAQYILNSVLSSFVPLYTKAEQVAEGGQSAYDVNGPGIFPFPPATKKSGGSALQGLSKALRPYRSYEARPPKDNSSSSSSSSSSSGSGGGGFWDGTSGAGGSSFWSGG